MAQLDPVGWFRSAHPEQGSLRVQVSSGRGLFPGPGAEVEVYRDFGAVRETFYTGVTEQLKAENQMEWVRQMNACKAQAEEIVKAELIYD